MLVLLLCSIAFGSSVTPSINPVLRTFKGKVFTRIYACDETGADVTPVNQIRDLAETATQVVITQGNEFVISAPYTYPIQALRKALTFSFQLNPPAATIYANQQVISNVWSGPTFLLDALWNSCGNPRDINVDGVGLFWSCNNAHGLHLSFSGSICYWDYTAKYTGPIEIYIDAGSRPNSAQPFVPPPPPAGCDACKNYGNKWWTRIFRCTNTTGLTFTDTVQNIASLANDATQVIITDSRGYYVTSNPGTYPIQRLRLGQTISFQLPPNSPWAIPEVIAQTWTGPSFLMNCLWSACYTASSIDQKMFWACNNGAGLHLTNDGHCEWEFGKTHYSGPIEIYIDKPCTCGGYAPPPRPQY